MRRYAEHEFSVTPFVVHSSFSLCQHKKGHHLEVPWVYLGTSVSCAAGCRPTQETRNERRSKIRSVWNHKFTLVNSWVCKDSVMYWMCEKIARGGLCSHNNAVHLLLSHLVIFDAL